MAADLQPKTPSPEFVAVLTWLTHNLWVTVSALIVLLGRIVFGGFDTRMKSVEEGQKEIMELLTKIQIDQAEIKGELKARKPTK